LRVRPVPGLVGLHLPEHGAALLVLRRQPFEVLAQVRLDLALGSPR
jgi:hypothetical protein